jgi:hypothetical protein
MMIIFGQHMRQGITVRVVEGGKPMNRVVINCCKLCKDSDFHLNRETQWECRNGLGPELKEVNGVIPIPDDCPHEGFEKGE